MSVLDVLQGAGATAGALSLAWNVATYIRENRSSLNLGVTERFVNEPGVNLTITNKQAKQPPAQIIALDSLISGRWDWRAFIIPWRVIPWRERQRTVRVPPGTTPPTPGQQVSGNNQLALWMPVRWLGDQGVGAALPDYLHRSLRLRAWLGTGKKTTSQYFKLSQQALQPPAAAAPQAAAPPPAPPLPGAPVPPPPPPPGT